MHLPEVLHHIAPTTEAKLKFLEEVILVEVFDCAVMAAIRNSLFFQKNSHVKLKLMRGIIVDL